MSEAGAAANLGRNATWDLTLQPEDAMVIGRLERKSTWDLSPQLDKRWVIRGLNPLWPQHNLEFDSLT